MHLVFKRTAKDQRRTKEEPRNDQRTPNHQNVLFVKIAIYFTSLIPSPISPTDDREKSDRTPTQLPASPKALFLRLLPKQVFFVPEKVDSHPKKVNSFPETIDFLFFLKKKSPQKRFFLHISKKKCIFAPKYAFISNQCLTPRLK